MQEITMIVTAEIFSALFMTIILIGIINKRNKTKSTRMLISVFVWCEIALLIDALSYIVDIYVGRPSLKLALNAGAYSVGFFVIISFILYFFAFVGERRTYNKWLLRIPVAVMAASAVGAICTSLYFGFGYDSDGVAIQDDVSTSIFSGLRFACMIYLVIVSFALLIRIGLKYAIIASLFQFISIISAIIIAEFEIQDFSFVVSSVATVVLSALHDNIFLNELEREQKRILDDRMSIIQSCARIYTSFYVVSIQKNYFYELGSSDSVRNIIGLSGEAQSKFLAMCDYIVYPEDKETMLEFTDTSTLPERLKDKLYITCQFRSTTSNGGWVEGIYIVVNRDADGKCTDVIWATRNIDEDKKKEQEQQRLLEKARDDAESANNAKTVFLNNMSHDIRTPMNAILGFVHLMEKHKNEPEVISKYLEKIEDSGQYLLSIINNVLDMARIDSGKMELDHDVIDLERGAQNIIELFRTDISKKKLKTSVRINLEHRYIVGDQARITQILVNLISNAVKYTPDGGRIKVEVSEKPCDREGYATYVATVSDNGVGMSEEFQKHIFDSFTRERNTTESKVIGTGLGMSIVKKLVDLMGGTIEIESKLGEGSKFTVTITSEVIEDPIQLGEDDQEGSLDNLSLTGMRVLLAEDNVLNAEIATMIIDEMGVSVDHAIDGVECVNMLNKSAPGYYDLILMDIQMPNMDGYRATTIIRKNSDAVKANIPIIAMTANAFAEDKAKALNAGMNGHIAKPINVSALKKTLKKIYDDKAKDPS